MSDEEQVDAVSTPTADDAPAKKAVAKKAVAPAKKART